MTWTTKAAVVLAATLAVCLLAPGPVRAGQTTIQQNPAELSLDAPGGILDQLYGLASLTRVEDFGSFPDDQIWRQVATGSAMARARFAARTHRFGYYGGTSSTFNALFDVTGTTQGIFDPPGPTVFLPTGVATLRFGLQVLNGTTVVDTWSSRQTDNGDGGKDHMVAWRIAGPGNRFVIAWEDLAIGTPGPSDPEPDYNDLVIELSEIAPDGCGNGALDAGEQCDDGNLANGDCCSSACRIEPNGSSCADGDLCNGAETCQAGVCTAGAPLVCNDSNVCTTDSCNPLSGCVYTPNTAPCNDGNACTTADTCSGGSCVGGPALVCNDSNLCTDDSCNPASGCVYVNNTAPCDDSNACTTADTCSGGSCAGGPALVCNDGNVCTSDSCNPATGCVYANNTAPCSDGNPCTDGDVCSGGSCIAGGPALCDDGSLCTDDSCNLLTGCQHTPNPGLCPTGVNQPVRPILECVVEHGPGDFTAHFGFLNENSVAVTIPVGSDNRFFPLPLDRGQLTAFAPGRSSFYPDAAFQVHFDGSPLTWTLRSPSGVTSTSSASSASARCPQVQLLRQHSICYSGYHKTQTPKPPKLTLQTLEDLLGESDFDVTVTRGLCAPLQATHGGQIHLVLDAMTHLKARTIALSRTDPQQPKFVARRDLVVSDMFGNHRVDLTRYERTLLPAAVCNPFTESCPPAAGDLSLAGLATGKFKCYRAMPTRGAPRFPKDVNMIGVDRFQSRVYRVVGPKMVCTRASLEDDDLGASADPQGLVCHGLRVPRQYCEPGAPAPFSLAACRRSADCGGAQCLQLPKPLLNARVPGVEIRAEASAQDLVTLYPQMACVPGVLTLP
jgi:cysteine-rich repeat protein